MKPYTKLLAGGALFATTALTTGSVFAATIVDYTAGSKPATIKAKNIATNLVSGTKGSTTVLGPMEFGLATSASTPFTGTTSVRLDFTGAQVNVTGATVTANAGELGTSGTLLAASTTGVTATVFSDHILISSISSTWSVLDIGGVQFQEAQSLASVGASITVAASIKADGDEVDTAPATKLVTSVAGPAVTVTANATAIKANGDTSPPFINLGSNPTVLTAVLGTITISDSGLGFGTDLATTLATADLVTTSEITITHPVLANAAVVSATVGSKTHTAAEMTSGTQTFTVATTELDDATDVVSVMVVFNGSTQITGGKGGTATVTFASGNTSGIVGAGAIASATGALADVTQNGLSTEVNTAQASTSAFQSFIRIHNTSATAGVATIVVKNDKTGETIGTYTTASIPAGATLQVGTGDIEAGLNLTPDATVPYTLDITGAFNGYVQHLAFDGHSVVDLSSFRNGTGTAP